MRTIPRAAIPVALAAVFVGTPGPAYALRVAFTPPAQRTVAADVVVVGKVTGLSKELVPAAPYPGAKEKVNYRVATVKVASGLVGADRMTEVKVGFIPPPKVDPNAKQPPVIRPGRGPQAPQLAEGQELILFLGKHPSGEFYIIPGMSPPVDLKDDADKKQLESVKKVAAILADPSKALKSDKPETRAEAAAVVVAKYRSYPAFGGEVDQVAVPAEESKQLLKALTEGEWSSMHSRFDGPPTPLQAFQQLALTPKDGWVEPVIASQPGAPPVDYGLVMRDAFGKWLDGPGKNYQIKKNVPKAPGK